MTMNIPTFFIPRLSKIYPNFYFWFENIPSGNPGKWLERKDQINSRQTFEE
jgi:hypothetical protein